jgi:hypothetical protein
MPGANWHRDTTWVVEEGSGVGTLIDPRGMQWLNALGPGLYSTDVGNGRAQKLDDFSPSTGFWAIDGARAGKNVQPADRRLGRSLGIRLRHRQWKQARAALRSRPNYIQRVDLEPNENGLPLLNPVAAAANDSMVYVADRGRNEVVRYQRRK